MTERNVTMKIRMLYRKGKFSSPVASSRHPSDPTMPSGSGVLTDLERGGHLS